MDLKPMFLPIELVLNVITCLLPKYQNVIIQPSHPITQTLLSFTLVCRETRRVASRYLRQHCVYLSSEARLQSFLLQMPDRPEFRIIPSIFLAPFKNTIANQPAAAWWVRELLQYTNSSLKRLIIDIPLQSLHPADDDHLDPRNDFHTGFKALENLEDFVSVQDELYFDVNRHFGELLWTHWRKLKRLALYNALANSDFWEEIAGLPHLETLVLTRADSLREWNVKEEYFKYTSRPIKVLLVNVEEDQVRFGNMQRVGWDAADPEKKMTIMTYNVPRLYADEDPITVCQDHVRAGAENGSLWLWEGEVIQHFPKIPSTAVHRIVFI